MAYIYVIKTLNFPNLSFGFNYSDKDRQNTYLPLLGAKPPLMSANQPFLVQNRPFWVQNLPFWLQSRLFCV